MTSETMKSNRAHRVTGCVAACCAVVIACFALLSAIAPSAMAAERTARLDVFQIYNNAGWTGLTDTYRYCLEAEDQNAPMPEADSVSGEGTLQGNKFYFTLNGTDGSASSPHQMHINTAGFAADSYTYHLYMDSDAEDGYDYRRFYLNNAETSSYDFSKGADAVREATEYTVVVYPNEAGSEPVVTYLNKAGDKVSGAGWQVSFVRTTGTVTFVRNVRGSNTTRTQTMELGKTAKLDANTFTRSGYWFVGWNTRADGSGTSYSDGQNYKMTPANLILYAQWERAIDPNIPRLITIPVYPAVDTTVDDAPNTVTTAAATPAATTPAAADTPAATDAPTPAATTEPAAPADEAQDTPEGIEEPPAEETIDGNDNPLAGRERLRYWSLIDLIATIASTVIGCVLIIAAIRRRKAAQHEGDQAPEGEQSAVEQLEEKRRKRLFVMSMASAIPAIGSIVAFVLTQDIGGQVVWVDMWTILFVALLVVNVALAIIYKKKSGDKNDPSQESGNVELAGAYS